MQVDIVSRKAIKPCSPTPAHLATYNISLVDELNDSLHVLRIFYYASDDDHAIDCERMVIGLEESLARVLVPYYPLAGRYDPVKHVVDCNDEGAEFIVTEVDCQLQQVFGKIDDLNCLLPVEIGAVDDPTDPILAVQVNRFKCGGVAIGVCVSLRVFDSCSHAMFLKDWANAATNGGLVICPDFDAAAYFPSENASPLPSGLTRIKDNGIVTKRLVFDKDAISELRGRLMKCWTNERPPSRVVVVSAILAQAILRADHAKQGKSRASIIGQTINIRERTIPPISKYACGYWDFKSFLESIPTETYDLANDFPKMATKMHKVTTQGIKDCARIFLDREFGRQVMIDSKYKSFQIGNDPETKAISITDWSKFGDYDLDFGFGKPVWVSLVQTPVKDLVVLMNTKNNDGIEAWLSMHESDMQYLELDEDLGKLTHHTSG